MLGVPDRRFREERPRTVVIELPPNCSFIPPRTTGTVNLRFGILVAIPSSNIGATELQDYWWLIFGDIEVHPSKRLSFKQSPRITGEIHTKIQELDRPGTTPE
jgi:hypothetical protein